MTPGRKWVLKLRLRLAMWLLGDRYRVYAQAEMYGLSVTLMHLENYVIASGSLNDGTFKRRAAKRIIRGIHAAGGYLGESVRQVQSTLNN